MNIQKYKKLNHALLKMKNTLYLKGCFYFQ